MLINSKSECYACSCLNLHNYPPSPPYKNHSHVYQLSSWSKNQLTLAKYTSRIEHRSLKSRLSHIINPHPKKKPYSPTMARSYNNHSFLDYISYFSMPIHLFFFISILFSILCLSWYINYEDKFEDLINQVKLFLMLSPVVLLLLVHCLSSCFPVFLPFPERDSLHRAGGSPWGVALLLVFLIFMISYQSSFHELW